MEGDELGAIAGGFADRVLDLLDVLVDALTALELSERDLYRHASSPLGADACRVNVRPSRRAQLSARQALRSWGAAYQEGSHALPILRTLEGGAVKRENRVVLVE